MASAGVPHIAFADGSGLRLARRQSDGTWAVEEVAPQATAILSCSLAFDAQNSPHIGYSDPDRQAVRHATRAAAVWTSSDLATTVAAEFCSLRVGTNGVVHACYWSLDRGLEYARLDGASITVETVDPVKTAGLYVSLDLDHNGQPQAAYYDPVTGGIKLARRIGKWTIETVDASGDVGGFASLIVDEFGTERFAYYDWSGRGLRFAESNKAPRPKPDHLTTTVNVPVNGNVLQNDVSPLNNALAATTTPVILPQHGKVTILANGDVRYTPDEGFNGTDTFRYQVCDSLGACESADVTIDVQIREFGSVPVSFAPTIRAPTWSARQSARGPAMRCGTNAATASASETSSSATNCLGTVCIWNETPLSRAHWRRFGSCVARATRFVA